MTRDQEVFTAGFIAGLARAAHLRSPHSFPAAPDLMTAIRLFEQSGGLAAFMTLQGVKSLDASGTLTLHSLEEKAAS